MNNAEKIREAYWVLSQNLSQTEFIALMSTIELIDEIVDEKAELRDMVFSQCEASYGDTTARFCQHAAKATASYLNVFEVDE